MIPTNEYVVIEIDNNSIPMEATICSDFLEAIGLALDIARDNDYNKPDDEIRQELEEQRYSIVDDGWIIAILRLRRLAKHDREE